MTYALMDDLSMMKVDYDSLGKVRLSLRWIDCDSLCKDRFKLDVDGLQLTW